MPPPGSRPSRREPLDELPYLARVVRWGSEVPRSSVVASLREQPFRERHVAAEAVEHELPGSHRLRISKHWLAAFVKRLDHIGHELIRRPVAAADDVTGT